MGRMLTAVIALLGVIMLVLLLLLGFGGSRSPQAAACVTGATSAVNVAGLPQRPVAGYQGEQLRIAALIMRAAQDRGLSLRDQQLGVMTAMGESTLRNLAHGDKVRNDTIGVFQEGPERGSYADRMDPYKAAGIFYDYLEKRVPVSDRATREPTLIAHTVQNNRDPWHYERHWNPAVEVVAALSSAEVSNPGTTAASPAAPAVPAGPARQYALPGSQPESKQLAAILGPQFGIKTIGGFRLQSEDPTGHPAGLALDFMTDDLANGKATGDRLAAYAQANAEKLGIKYVIWWQRQWSVRRSDEGWRPMGDRGSPTANHYDHVHISLVGGSSPSADGAIAPPTGLGCGTPNGQPATDGTGAETAAGDGAPPAQTASGWVRPAAGRISDTMRMRDRHPVTGERRMHYGLDIAPGCNAPIYAASAGIVTRAGAASGYGNAIDIDHGGGLSTRYGHMYDAGVLARVGQRVTAGQLIGRVGSSGGSTGCHLHFEVRRDGTATDPQAFLDSQGVSAR